jgi:transmembrane sensor
LVCPDTGTLRQSTNVIEMDDQNMGIDPLEREAIGWIRRVTSGQMTAAEGEALKLWRSRSPAHAAALSAANRLWKDLEPAGRDWRRHATAGVLRASAQPPSPLMNRRALLGSGLAVAAAAAAYVGARPPLGLWPSWMELRADYRTGTGEQREVSLSADVSVRMNTQTSIAVRPADNDTERVELIGGEASFSKRAGRSFAVLAADQWITANEARFDVRHLHGRIASAVRVTCLQGTLNIARGSEATTLTSGQQLRYDSGGVAGVEAADPDIATAWYRGVLIFRFTPLSDVVEEINRYRPGRIVVVNSEISRIPVSGRFRIDALDEVLSQFKQGFGAKIRLLPGGLVLLS